MVWIDPFGGMARLTVVCAPAVTTTEVAVALRVEVATTV